MALAAPVGRARRALRRYGVAGALGRSLELARAAAAGSEEEHVWYELPLAPGRPRRELDPAFVLVAATEDQLPHLDELWAIDRAEALRRLTGDGALWLVLAAGRPAFSCWTFRGRMPIRSADGGWLALPDDTANLEESMTAAAYRGRSLAPAAWSLIADRLAADGLRRLVTKVEERNAASRAAVVKAGFREIGRTVATRRRGRATVRLSGEPEATAFLRPRAGQPPP